MAMTPDAMRTICKVMSPSPFSFPRREYIEK
jgi:hypothetical protein